VVDYCVMSLPATDEVLDSDSAGRQNVTQVTGGRVLCAHRAK
jgi:hypothetical protein